MSTISEILEQLTDTKDWHYDCTAYGEGQACCCDKGHENQARLEQAINAYIAEVIGEDEPLPMDDRDWDRIKYRHQLRNEQRERL